jgi:hypothetical protein
MSLSHTRLPLITRAVILSFAGMSKDDAMKAYVDAVNEWKS